MPTRGIKAPMYIRADWSSLPYHTLEKLLPIAMMYKFVFLFAALLPVLTSAQTYSASFTEYGTGDQNDSGSCNVATTACGFFTSPGYSAAVSQNLYGAGQGVGPACGGCWQISGDTDSSGQPLSSPQTIVVMVTNLCPADGNSLCSQPNLASTNQYGAQVNFDLCIDSEAAAAFLGPSGVGLAVGTATQVDCSQWSGTEVK